MVCVTSMDVDVALADVRVKRGSREILRGATCRFEPGVTALLGRNGAGKTTLLRTIATLEKPSHGLMTLGGQDPFESRTALKAYRSNLGWMPQHPELVQRARVVDAVGYAAWLAEIPRAERGAAVSRALQAVGLEPKSRRRIGELSGGQQRRVALACSLVAEPRILLLDEPTVGLDPEQRQHFLETVATDTEARVVILSTHLMEDVLAVADRVLVVDEGLVTETYDVAELRSRFSTDMTGALEYMRSSISPVA